MCRGAAQPKRLNQPNQLSDCVQEINGRVYHGVSTKEYNYHVKYCADTAFEYMIHSLCYLP